MSGWNRRIYTFNIIAEAKVRTLVIMTKKTYPDWTLEQIEDFVKRLLGYAIERQKREDELNKLFEEKKLGK